MILEYIANDVEDVASLIGSFSNEFHDDKDALRKHIDSVKGLGYDLRFFIENGKNESAVATIKRILEQMSDASRFAKNIMNGAKEADLKHAKVHNNEENANKMTEAIAYIIKNSEDLLESIKYNFTA